MRRWLVRAALAAGLVAAVATVATWRWYVGVRDAFRAELDDHLALEVTHPGWSFPGRVWSAPAALDLPPARRVAHARARGYAEACPATQPGTVCVDDGTVVPRPPPRALAASADPTPAMEPVLIGWLVGPDAEIREHLPVDEAPDALVAAILAAEDADFYAHVGVDLPGLLRAAWSNAQQGGYGQGASTLAMQVVRNVTGRKERTLGRKLTEIAQAVALDRSLGKRGVLQLYLDVPYLGQDGPLSVCGFQAASRVYFGHDAAELTLAEAATLAAILPAPGRFAPDRHPEEARARRDVVLRALQAQGWDVDEALASPVTVHPVPATAERFPSYLAIVRDALSTLPERTRTATGLQVHTALDVVAQERSEAFLAAEVPKLQALVRRHDAPLLAAVAVIDPHTGHLVTAVDTGQATSVDLDRVTQAHRQPGSAFKPVVYALALDARNDDGSPRFTAASTLPNTRTIFPGTNGWMPRNVGGHYAATASIAHALRSSANIASAHLLEEAGGPEALRPFAGRLGFDADALPHDLGVALGQGEVTVHQLTRFVATVVEGGLAVQGSPVVAVQDLHDRVVVEDVPPHEPVMSPESAALTRELMGLVVSWGTGGAARGANGRIGVRGPLVGKTGTTDDERDLWFAGATPAHAAVLWLGYDQPARIGASASDLAAPLWGWWMHELEDGLEPGTFDGPELQRVGICTLTGKRPGPGCEVLPAPFVPGTAPRAVCDGDHPAETSSEDGPYKSLFRRLAEAREAAADGDADTDTPAP